MWEVLGYVIIIVLAAYLIPRLMAAAVFQSWKDFKKANKEKGNSDGQKRA